MQYFFFLTGTARIKLFVSVFALSCLFALNTYPNKYGDPYKPSPQSSKRCTLILDQFSNPIVRHDNFSHTTVHGNYFVVTDGYGRQSGPFSTNGKPSKQTLSTKGPSSSLADPSLPTHIQFIFTAEDISKIQDIYRQANKVLVSRLKNSFEEKQKNKGFLDHFLSWIKLNSRSQQNDIDSDLTHLLSTYPESAKKHEDGYFIGPNTPYIDLSQPFQKDKIDRFIAWQTEEYRGSTPNSILDLNSGHVEYLENLQKAIHGHVSNFLGTDTGSLKIYFHFPHVVGYHGLHVHARFSDIPAVDLPRVFGLNDLITHLKAGQNTRTLILERQKSLGGFYVLPKEFSGLLDAVSIKWIPFAGTL